MLKKYINVFLCIVILPVSLFAEDNIFMSDEYAFESLLGGHYQTRLGLFFNSAELGKIIPKQEHTWNHNKLDWSLVKEPPLLNPCLYGLCGPDGKPIGNPCLYGLCGPDGKPIGNPCLYGLCGPDITY